MEAAGSAVTFETATEFEHEIRWRDCDDLGLAAESTLHPGESDCDFRSRMVCALNASRAHRRI